MSGVLDLVVAFGLVLVIEGLAWAGFPDAMRRAALRLGELPTALLRRGGLAAMATGVLVIWWMRG